MVIDQDALEQKVRSFGSDFMEKENPNQLKQFREKVLSKISSFFKSDSDIKLCVYECISELSYKSDLKGWVSALEIEDTKSLHDEIATLRSELERTKSELQSRPPKLENSRDANNFQHEIESISSVKINIPENVGGPTEASLIDLFYNNKDVLINGVTNAYNASDAENFFYHNLAPKLMLYNLMANEKVNDAKYRRSFVTAKGLSVLAEIEKRYQNYKKEQQKNITNSSSKASK